MKTLKEYLIESKKVYSFKIKVAGDIVEGFEDQLKSRLDRCRVISFEKQSTTPVQKVPLDFPTLTNTEVTVYEAILEYPITSGEIAEDIKKIGLEEKFFRVRGSGEPTEVEQIEMHNEKSGEAFLQDPGYTETENADHKEYFGAEFNTEFLKDLAAAAKEREAELGKNQSLDPNVLGTLGKVESDKSGISSPVGSK